MAWGTGPLKDWGTGHHCNVPRKPNLNWFAENGANGIMDPIGPGIRPGSDTSHLAILGYDPFTSYTGRGPFEAAGVGIVSEKGDVAFRCDFATVDDHLKVLDRRAGRIRPPDTGPLATALNDVLIDDVRIMVKEATEHRAVLVLRGRDLSPMVTDVDPHERSIVQESRILNARSRKNGENSQRFRENVP